MCHLRGQIKERDTILTPAKSLWQRIVEILSRPFDAAIAFLGHVLLGVIVMGGIWVTGLAFRMWFPEHEQPLLFDRIPVKWMFDASKFAILSVFIVYGAIDAIKRLRH